MLFIFIAWQNEQNTMLLGLKYFTAIYRYSGHIRAIHHKWGATPNVVLLIEVFDMLLTHWPIVSRTWNYGMFLVKTYRIFVVSYIFFIDLIFWSWLWVLLCQQTRKLNLQPKSLPAMSVNFCFTSTTVKHKSCVSQIESLSRILIVRR